jgi:ABC-type cobalamin/Fe3+-siderophores transport system ATPase subunit
MNYDIIFPDRNGTAGQETITTENNIVLIGANGSGKTRLGVRIEELTQNSRTVHRISAQKALNIPDYAEIKSLEQAEKELLFGRSDEYANIGQKMKTRWGRKPATFLLDDYSRLLSLLFAKSTERDRDYTLAARENESYTRVPDAPTDRIIALWNTIIPHRAISFADGKVMAQKTGHDEYHGQEMSDGERVMLYLIGQCLCIPENSIIIIDEPEIHLHKSLVDKLWNQIESHIQNKLLIYITHDLDFAASRADAMKIWIQEYNGNNQWIWQETPVDQNLPEGLMLEIIGNRKDVIFCEGESGKLDSIVYQLVYPNHHIIPRGGADKVIEATKAFRSNTSLHHLTAHGIIDSDYKEAAEITALSGHNVHTISVAEIENLFCIEPILRIIAEHLELEPNVKVGEVVDFLITSLTKEFDVQVSSKIEKIIEYKLGSFSKESNSEQGILDGFNTTIGRIDIPVAYEETRIVFQTAISNRSLEELLLIYNRKTLPDRISGIFGLANGEYGKLLIRLLKGSRQAEIITALKQFLPEI